MVFCGQCGLQLSPGDTCCPRCGALVDAEALDDPRPDDPTVALPPYATDPTAQLSTRQLNTHSLPTYAPQNPQPLILGEGREYAQGGRYPGYSSASHSGYIPIPATRPYQRDITAQNARGRAAALILILLGLLLILGALVLFAAHHGLLNVFSGTGIMIVSLPPCPGLFESQIAEI